MNNGNLSYVMIDLKNQVDKLKKQNKKYLTLLKDFGYPDNKPQPKADIVYWKEKYRMLMEEKVRIERERNKLFESLVKLVGRIDELNLDVDLKEFNNIIGQSGVSLIPGNGEIANINYKPFDNAF